MPEVEVGSDLSADAIAAIAADILGGGQPTQEEPAKGGEPVEVATEPETPPTAEPTPTEPAAEGGGKTEEAPTAPANALDAYIASKYGGDPNKFMDGLYNLMNSGSRQHQEIQELRARLEQALTKPEPPVDPLDTEDGQGLKQQLTAVDRRIQSAGAEQNDILGRIDKARDEVAELRGELKRAEDFDKPSLKAQITAREAEIKADERRFRELESSKEDHLLRKSEIQAQVKTLKARLADQQEARQSAVAQAEAVGKKFRTGIDTAVAEAVTAAGYKAGSPDYEKASAGLHKYLRGQAALFWMTNPETPLDPAAFVGEHAGDYLGSGVQKKIQEKVAAAGAAGKPAGLATPGKPAAAVTLPKKMTAQQSLEWRRKIMGG